MSGTTQPCVDADKVQAERARVYQPFGREEGLTPFQVEFKTSQPQKSLESHYIIPIGDPELDERTIKLHGPEGFEGMRRAGRLAATRVVAPSGIEKLETFQDDAEAAAQ